MSSFSSITSANSSAPSDLEQLPQALRKPLDCLMIDNFDSFTWNLYQSLTLLGVEVTVIRNNAIPVSALPLLNIRRLIISPGPGNPQSDSGISIDAIRHFTGKVPVLGVCMGLECIVEAFGGEIGYAGEVKHGKLSPIRHDGRGLFSGLPQSFSSTRYHSLSASIKSLPPCLSISAISEESGVIMGIRHRVYAIEAVQYHPESVLSQQGDSLLINFLKITGGTWEENPTMRVTDLANELPSFEIKKPDEEKIEGKQNKLPTILEKIHLQRLKDIDIAKSTPGTTPEDLETLLALNLAPPLVDVMERLRVSYPASLTTPPMALMAEIKRASPSKGNIALRTNAAQQALTYALAGASVISVLTEPTWFKGSLLDMRLAREAIAAVPNRPAILRKDFIVSEYQIAEARLHGADTVLLIVAMLPRKRLSSLYAYAKRLGMEPLVEVNNAEEMALALEVGARLVGVNNRNLHNFEVDMGTTTRLVDMVRDRDVTLCALSGISNREDVKTYSEQGVRAVLVGEALMRAVDTHAYVRELLGWENDSLGQDKRDQEGNSEAPLVKICGIRTVEEALSAARAGADMLGLMFVPTSKRAIKIEDARGIALAVRSLRAVMNTEMAEVSETTSVPKSLNADKKEDEEDLGRNAVLSSSLPSQPQSTLGRKPWFASHASSLSSSVRSGARPLLVGVFQDATLEYVKEVVSAAQLDMVQLHGREPVEWARWISVPVIKVFHVPAAAAAAAIEDAHEAASANNAGNDAIVANGERDANVHIDASTQAVSQIARPGYHRFVLLDAVRPSLPGESTDRLSGGTGRVVDWDLARNLVDAGEDAPRLHAQRVYSLSVSSASTTDSGIGAGIGTGASAGGAESDVEKKTKAGRLPIILAGGLEPSNVREAVERVRPWAVDVSGGVENAVGGGKDNAKVVAFVRAAKDLPAIDERVIAEN